MTSSHPTISPTPESPPAQTPDLAPPAAPKPPRPSKRGIALSLIASVFIILAGAGVFAWLTGNPKTSERHSVAKTARLVEVVEVEVGDHTVTVSAMGEAKPARQIDLSPQVAGRIVRVAPALIPGGRFIENEPLVEIDRADYVLALSQRESEAHQARSVIETARADLITAQRELALEEGNQVVSRREYELLGQDIPEQERSLILRQPQLQAAQADVSSAESAVEAARSALTAAENRFEQAELDLSRTSVFAPFNAIVMEKMVEIGDVVSTTTPVATLVGTDQAWIEISVPASDLKWIAVPRGDQPGSEVEIRQASAWGSDATRRGRVIQLLPQLETEGRMARMLIAVDDPFAFEADDISTSPALLMGSYVRVRITGPTLSDVVRLPRALLWEDDTIRLMNDQDELEIRQVTVLYKEQDHVLIRTGLAAGDRVVTTGLGVAVDGLPLRLDENNATAEANP